MALGESQIFSQDSPCLSKFSLSREHCARARALCLRGVEGQKRRHRGSLRVSGDERQRSRLQEGFRVSQRGAEAPWTTPVTAFGFWHPGRCSFARRVSSPARRPGSKRELALVPPPLAPCDHRPRSGAPSPLAARAMRTRSSQSAQAFPHSDPEGPAHREPPGPRETERVCPGSHIRGCSMMPPKAEISSEETGPPQDSAEQPPAGPAQSPRCRAAPRPELT